MSIQSSWLQLSDKRQRAIIYMEEQRACLNSVELRERFGFDETDVKWIERTSQFDIKHIRREDLSKGHYINRRYIPTANELLGVKTKEDMLFDMLLAHQGEWFDYLQLSEWMERDIHSYGRKELLRVVSRRGYTIELDDSHRPNKYRMVKEVVAR